MSFKLPSQISGFQIPR